ncbi:MAG: Xaa-Pro aminopeptidase, partial [Candidatus Marinimicrobia bacterium]|nr:Xaa-Pro aminopeptidase [Candidatus Neomarinimicrobiota bacterium]
MRRIGFILSFFISLVQADDLKDDILSMDQRAVVRDGFLKDRFETVLPEIMARNNMDMWIIIAREYNEDPVIRTML